MRLDKLTDLEIGKKYIDIDKDTYTIAYIGKKRFFYYNQLGEECIGDEKDISIYELRPYEEKKEKWYEILAYNSLGIGNHRFCDSKSLSNYEVEVDVLRQWDSKEEMIKDLKKG